MKSNVYKYTKEHDLDPAEYLQPHYGPDPSYPNPQETPGDVDQEYQVDRGWPPQGATGETDDGARYRGDERGRPRGDAKRVDERGMPLGDALESEEQGPSKGNIKDSLQAGPSDFERAVGGEGGSEIGNIGGDFSSIEIDEPVEIEPPDGGWGWLVIIAAFILMMMATIPSICFGVLFAPLLIELGTSSTMIAWVFNLAFVVSGLATCLVGPVIEEVGCRKVAMSSGLLFSIGITISAYANSAEFLIFSFSVLTGSNIYILILISYISVSNYFVQWRNVANAFMSTGACVSLLVMPLLIAILQEEFAFRGATLIIGVLTLNCCAAAMILHPIEWHQKSSTYPRSTSRKGSISSVSTADLSQNIMNIMHTAEQNLRYMGSPLVVIIAVIVSMHITVLFNIFTIVPFAMKHDGFTSLEASFCMTVAGVCNLAARLMTACFTCCRGKTALLSYLLGSFIAALAIAEFNVVNGLVWKAVTLGLCGIGYGLSTSLDGLIVVEELGLAMLLPTLSITYFVSGLLFLTVGPLAGLIRDVTDSYTVSLCFCAACLLLSVLLGLCVPAAQKYEQRKEAERQQERQLELQRQKQLHHLKRHHQQHTQEESQKKNDLEALRNQLLQQHRELMLKQYQEQNLPHREEPHPAQRMHHKKSGSEKFPLLHRTKSRFKNPDYSTTKANTEHR